MVTTEQLHGWQNMTVFDSAGEEIGTVESTYEDAKTGKPDWLTVKSGGLLRKTISFVPAIGASEEGEGVKLKWDRDTVEGAPEVDDSGALTPDVEQQLRKHYGVDVEEFGYDEDEEPQQSQDDADKQAKDERSDARRDAKNLVRPEDTAVEADGSQVRPDK